MRYSISLFVALLVLVACGKDDADAVDSVFPPVSVDENAVYIRAGFAPLSYATTAMEEEKRMTSVAFFIEAEDGAFFRFFSAEALQSAMGFEEMTKDEAGNCVGVTIRLENGNLGTSKLAVIGNYDTYGLASELTSVASMDELLALKVSTPVAGIVTPLPMYEQRIIKITHGKVTEWDGSSFQPIFTMKQLVARIDLDVAVVIDNGGGWGDVPQVDDLIEAGRFECFALLYGPKSESFLLPAAASDISALPQMERYDDKISYKDGKIRFYVYEMTGDEPESLEAYIICRYRETKDAAWTEDMYALTLVGQTSDKSHFERNHIYTPQTVSFDFSITDWDEAEWLNAHPKP